MYLLLCLQYRKGFGLPVDTDPKTFIALLQLANMYEVSGMFDERAVVTVVSRRMYTAGSGHMHCAIRQKTQLYFMMEAAVEGSLGQLHLTSPTRTRDADLLGCQDVHAMSACLHGSACKRPLPPHL